MLWHTGQANLIGRSTSQISVDVGNDNEDSPEMLSYPKGEKLAKVKKFGHKRKANSEILPHFTPKESIYFYCQLKTLEAKLP